MPEVTGTCVQIPLTDELLEAYNTMDQWFQPRYEGFISHGHPEVKGLYYHGFLVYKATEPWAYSYDVTNILKRNELSEDRQIRNVDLSSIFNRLVQHLSFDYDNGNLYNKAWSLSQAQDIERLFDAVYYEINHNHLEWGGPNGFKLSKLLASFYNHFGSKAAFSSSPITESDPNVYYAKAAGYTPVTITYRLHCILNGFSPAKSLAACLPSAAERLKKVKTVDMVRSEKLKSAMRIIKRVRMPDIKVEIVTKLYADDDMKFKALADLRNNRILLLETLLDEDIPTIAKVLIEEFAHIKSGGGDMSLTLQRELIDTIYDLLLGSRRVNVQNIQS